MPPRRAPACGGRGVGGWRGAMAQRRRVGLGRGTARSDNQPRAPGAGVGTATSTHHGKPGSRGFSGSRHHTCTGTTGGAPTALHRASSARSPSRRAWLWRRLLRWRALGLDRRVRSAVIAAVAAVDDVAHPPARWARLEHRDHVAERELELARIVRAVIRNRAHELCARCARAAYRAARGAATTREAVRRGEVVVARLRRRRRLVRR